MIPRPPKHQKSFAARFREVFELAERNGGIPPEVREPRPSYATLAADFRKAFEAAEQNAGVRKEIPPLAYYAKGVPAITAVGGIKRYLYADGSVDERSIVSPEVEARAYEVGRVVTQVEVIKEPESEEATETLGEQEILVAETVGPIATGEALAA